ncbi:hypothetical protein UF75_0457 [Desulfosporosinus sp. I2]|uniref:membrane protein n=1 Tax=Desulfosporosinus sp. I2 TaxID=1617025 RepID=UPI0005F0564B|nr:membrane protein [Desulfosporosinus sp. I2]KJR49157.1 hypothetical protein UF75_0457 [Desulfosporosinus sp. I2]
MGLDASTNAAGKGGEIISAKKQFGLSVNPITFALAHLTIILVVSLVVWNLFADPKQGIWKLYPQPFGAVMFWFILEVVFLAFNGELWPFHRLKQPLSGLVTFVTGAVLAFLTVGILVFGIGSYEPAFNPSGAGWTATGMIVLMGFYFFGILPTNMGHWPWVDLGLKQPWVGIIEFFEGFFLAFLGYLILIYPSVASWSQSGKVILPLVTAVGWFYSVIVSWLTTANALDNWPWSQLGSRAKTALVSLFGNFVIGTGIYFLFLAILKNFLIPVEAQKSLGVAITMWPAQLGVCILFWVLTWSTVFDNQPLNTVSKKVIRVVITYGLGLITFLVYTRWFAISVLHEAEISKGFGGDPLTWIDLMILVMLIYAVYFGSYGLIKKNK